MQIISSECFEMVGLLKPEQSGIMYSISYVNMESKLISFFPTTAIRLFSLRGWGCFEGQAPKMAKLMGR